MTKGQKIFALTTLFLIAGTVTIYAANQISKIKAACFKFLGVRNLKLQNGISGTIYLGIKNDSDISMVLKEQTYKVFINDIPVSDIKAKLDIPVEAKGVSQLPIDVKINIQELTLAGIKNAGNLLFDRDKVFIRLVGKVRAQAGIVDVKKIPVDVKWTIKELMDPTEDTMSKCY